MNLSNLPHDMVRYIIKFLPINSCISLRSVSRRFRKFLSVITPRKNKIYNNVFCLVTYNADFIMPNDLRILHIYDYGFLIDKKIPSTLETIFLKSLDDTDYELLNVKNLYIKKFIKKLIEMNSLLIYTES